MMQELVLSVTELNEYVRGLFSSDRLLSGLKIRGEISNFKRHSSGHMYFSLKDAGAVIRCVMFKQNAFGLKVSPRDGMSVVARGYVSLYVRDGSYQFYLEEMEPDGVGALYALYEKTKQRLLEKGYFDEAHKKPLPEMPDAIGVVTSPTGAVIRDIIKVARRRNPGINILLYPCRVQGEGAEQEIAQGIAALQKEKVDVIICGRGGGSLEDLWCFNEEIVAKAIYESRVPVISAVGHETDVTIADFTADLRAATPSQAAELAVPNLSETVQSFDYLQTRLHAALGRYMKDRRTRLDTLKARGAFHRAEDLFLPALQRLERHGETLNRLVKIRLERQAMLLEGYKKRLSSLNPENVLKRGYAIVEDKDTGYAYSSAAPMAPGKYLRIRMHDGGVNARVIAKDGTNGAEQLGLFDERGIENGG